MWNSGCPSATHRLYHRPTVPQSWCASRRLQLNTSKTELIWFGSQAVLHQSSPDDRTLSINDVTVQPAGVVRDLGVLLDNQLTMKQHVNRVASSCFFHLRRLQQIKRHVTPEAVNQLVAAVILCRLDYCNSVLAGLPWSTVAPLQRVQKSSWVFWCTWHTMDSRRCTLATPWRQSVVYHLVGDYALLTQQTTWCQGHVLSSGKEHSVFPGLWSGTLSPSHCELSISSQLFVAGWRLTFLTFTYHDFTFTVLVFSIIVDTCIAGPVRSVVGLAL